MPIVKYEIVCPVTDRKKPYIDKRGLLTVPDARKDYKYCIETMRYNPNLFAYEYFLLLGTGKFDAQCRRCRVDDYARLQVSMHGKLKDFVQEQVKMRGNVEVRYLESEDGYDVWQIL